MVACRLYTQLAERSKNSGDIDINITARRINAISNSAQANIVYKIIYVLILTYCSTHKIDNKNIPPFKGKTIGGKGSHGLIYKFRNIPPELQRIIALLVEEVTK